MSRVGKNPISLPDGINVKLQGSSVAVKGPKGELSWDIPAGMKVTVEDNNLKVERPSETKHFRSLHGTTRSIIFNMITGVNSGFKIDFDIIGVGYRAQVQGSKIVFTLGYSHPVEFNLPAGVSAEVDKKQTQLSIQGIDKQLLGQVAANIRALRPPDVYKGKGIRFKGEHIKLKAGKAGSK
jgi:large subunit ribosomal protein L6